MAMGTAICGTMNSHRFKIGNFECILVLDGTREYADPAKSMFHDAPKAELDEELRSYGIDPATWDKLVSPYPALVVFTRDHVVLVDTGADALESSTGKLIENLAGESISPEDVDTVILTHCHPDHIGGAVDHNGEAAFPNARYVISRTEWDFWSANPDLSQLSIPKGKKALFRTYVFEKLLPIKSRIEFLDIPSSGAEIVPGITAIDAAGHTPGHFVVGVESAEEQLLYLSDTVIHPIHIKRPEWHLSVDFDARQTTSTRRRILGQACSSGALVQVFHFPFPGLGHIVSRNDTWHWRPNEAEG